MKGSEKLDVDKKHLEEIMILEQTIAQLKERWPAHSVKPAMVQELEDLEDRLQELKENIKNIKEE